VPLQRVPGGAVDTDIDLRTVLWDGIFFGPVALCGHGSTGCFLFANEAMLELLGYPLEALQGHAWISALHPTREEQGRTREFFAALCRPGTTALHHQRSVTRGDGTQRFLHMISAPIAMGKEWGAVTMAFDITRIRNPFLGAAGSDPSPVASVSIEERGQNQPEAFARFDVPTGNLLFITDSAERLSGFTPEELYANPRLLRRSVLPEFQATQKEVIRRCLEGEAQWAVIGVRRKDGTQIMLHQALYPVRDASGRVTVVESVVRDVTPIYSLQKRLEQTIAELRERNEELASLDRLKSQLLANVSHELRTPLVSIKGYNDLLRRGALGPLTERQRRGLEIAGANTDRLIELIETLLDFAQREGGRLTVRRARLDVRLPIRDALAQMAERIRTRGLELMVDLGDKPLEVEGDHVRLVQVLRALLSNAEKFCEGAGQIRVAARHAGDEVRITVSDTGVGIPAGVQHKVFDRFYQVDASATRKFGGTGLGLSLAREIITLHGGRISVESVEGQGATFQVALPLAQDVEVAPRAEQPLLLVGASVALAPLLHGLLEREGFALLEAQSVVDLVRRARRHRPDALVLALGKPELTEALGALRGEAETHELPIIALVPMDERAEALSWADCVLAPEEMTRIPSRLRRLLGERDAPERRPRVVIVDDEPGILDFIRFILEREGCEVRCAVSSESALENIDESCDLVILDVIIDSHDGLDLCRRLKNAQATRDVPVIVATARSDDEVRQDSFRAGADGFLLKPFSVDDFIRQVRLHLRDPHPWKKLDTHRAQD
jgi:PAS domain S-box-containing protein